MSCWTLYQPRTRLFLPKVMSRQTQNEIGVYGSTFTFVLCCIIACFAPNKPSYSAYRDVTRERLVELYIRHNPSKLNQVDAILRKYAGNEELLFARLRKKYSTDSKPKSKLELALEQARAEQQQRIQERVESLIH